MDASIGELPSSADKHRRTDCATSQGSSCGPESFISSRPEIPAALPDLILGTDFEIDPLASKGGVFN